MNMMIVDIMQDLGRTQQLDNIIRENSLFLQQHPTPPRFMRDQDNRRPVRIRKKPIRYVDQDT